MLLEKKVIRIKIGQQERGIDTDKPYSSPALKQPKGENQ